MQANRQPQLVLDEQSRPQPVTLIVFAPFGSDALLSTYPDGESHTVEEHPLVQSLRQVSELGVNVCALVDRVKDDSWLVEIPAGGTPASRSVWKQDMGSPRVLANLIAHAHASFPGTAMVLALEGHGAGYLPEIDRARINPAELTRSASGKLLWEVRADADGGIRPVDVASGAPWLPMGCPMLPMGCPCLPNDHNPLSTWATGQALQHGLARAGSGGKPAQRIAVLHFNNCFNMAIELLHTVAPYAEYATAYSNYNFFTAGRSYPLVFHRLVAQGTATSEELARWFAEANRDALAAMPSPHPTTGSVVQLRRMGAIAAAVSHLAGALIAALPTHREAMRKAIRAAQQYDTGAGLQLDVPDNLTDVASLATQLAATAFSPAVTAAASDLAQSVAGIKQYGASGSPWVDPAVTWDFSASDLAMNILLPDPDLTGVWDWRSPYYLQTDPQAMPSQPQVIDFLRTTRWVEFLVRYHEAVPFIGLLAPRIPRFPQAQPRKRLGAKDLA